MAQQKMTSDEVVLEIEKTVQNIQKYDGSSGYLEEEWRKDQQELMRLLAENPLELYHLENELKTQIHAIVSAYLEWSFNAYW